MWNYVEEIENAVKQMPKGSDKINGVMTPRTGRGWVATDKEMEFINSKIEWIFAEFQKEWVASTNYIFKAISNPEADCNILKQRKQMYDELKGIFAGFKVAILKLKGTGESGLKADTPMPAIQKQFFI